MIGGASSIPKLHTTIPDKPNTIFVWCDHLLRQAIDYIFQNSISPIFYFDTFRSKTRCHTSLHSDSSPYHIMNQNQSFLINIHIKNLYIDTVLYKKRQPNTIKQELKITNFYIRLFPPSRLEAMCYYTFAWLDSVVKPQLHSYAKKQKSQESNVSAHWKTCSHWGWFLVVQIYYLQFIRTFGTFVTHFCAFRFMKTCSKVGMRIMLRIIKRLPLKLTIEVIRID